jgi:tetratricopeptide (TPR) repeat protein
MDQTEGYDDFADRLCDRVLTQESPDLLVYFAYFHAFNQNKYNLLNKLMEAQIGSDLTKLFELTSHARGGGPVEWSDFQQVISKALKMTRNDWMACHVYIVWREVVDNWFPEAATDSGPLEFLESRIRDDEKYNFFLASLDAIKARRYNKEGNIEDARKWYDSAIALAKKHNDLEKLGVLLFQKANLVKQVNFGEAMSLLRVQRKICDDIGCKDGLAHTAHVHGHITMARGEYDTAIRYQQEYLDYRESRGLPVGFMKCIIASLYNLVGDGKTAMSLIIDAAAEMLPDAQGYARLQEAWALLHLDQLEDAFESLEKAREISLKGGEETHIGLIHFVEGLIEKHKHDYPSALFSLERALEIFERTQSLSYTNMTLLPLVDIEIETYAFDKADKKTKTSGPWMQKLIEHIEQRDMLGVTAQAYLLEAKFRFKQGRSGDSKKLVKKAMKISEKTDNPYLKDMAEQVLPELSLA